MRFFVLFFFCQGSSLCCEECCSSVSCALMTNYHCKMTKFTLLYSHGGRRLSLTLQNKPGSMFLSWNMSGQGSFLGSDLYKCDRSNGNRTTKTYK